MFREYVDFAQNLYGTRDFIPLHAPSLDGNEKKYLLDCIDSTYVSSVGAYVDRFEADIREYTNSGYAIATVNGTAALHVGLLLAGVEKGDEVLTQSLSFVATCNAIRYCGADPVFIDVDKETAGLSPSALAEFLDSYTEVRDDRLWNKITGKRIAACVPMHTFGHPVDMDTITELCDKYFLPVIEDAAESLGSSWNQQHTGTWGRLGVFSFNGNKIITTGGGGMILTDDEELALRAKHLTTTAKINHSWRYEHDEVGFNYRLPNLNAALGVAQLERQSSLVEQKRAVAARYHKWSAEQGVDIISEPEGGYSNYWLNALVMTDKSERDDFLEFTNNHGVMTRPVWEPMHRAHMYTECFRGSLKNTEWLADRIVNIPSSPIMVSVG